MQADHITREENEKQLINYKLFLKGITQTYPVKVDQVIIIWKTIHIILKFYSKQQKFQKWKPEKEREEMNKIGNILN